MEEEKEDSWPRRPLTCFGDVERQPEQEGVADQLSEEQTEGKLHHALQTRARRYNRKPAQAPPPPPPSPGCAELP